MFGNLFDLTIIPYSLLVQGIGFLGVGFTAFSFTRENDMHLKLLLGTGAIILSLHFYLLGSLFGAMSAFVAGSRFLISTKYNHTFIFYIFMLFYGAMLIMNDGELMQYIPIIAGITGTIATFKFKGLHMRYLFLFGQFCWLIHNIYYVSVGGIIEQIMQLSLNIKTIRKIKKRHAQTTA